MNSKWYLVLLLALTCYAKSVSNTVTLGPENQWKYVTKFAVDVGKGNWTMRAKFLKGFGDGNDSVKVTMLIYLDDNWDDTLYIDSCTEKADLAKRDRALRLPTNGEWSAEISGTLSQKVVPHVWYFVLADCKGELETKQRIKLELTLTNSDGSHFSLEERGLTYLYVIVFGVFLATLWSNLVKLIRKFKKTENLETNLVLLNVSIGCNFISIVFEIIHIWVYSYNGRGVVVIDFFSQAFETISYLIITILFLLVASGWTIKYKELPDADVFVPVALLSVFMHLLIVGLGRVTDDTYYKFSDYEGVPGVLLIILRIGMWVWFFINIRQQLSETQGQVASFVLNFSIVASLYFLGVPILAIVSWLFRTYWRQKIITIGSLVIQTGIFFLLTYLFSEKSTYYKVSTMSQGILPGKIQ